MTQTRRQIITGLIGIIAAPAIVRYTSLMPVRAWKPWMGWDLGHKEFTVILRYVEFPEPSVQLIRLMEHMRETQEIIATNIFNEPIRELKL